MAQFLNVQIIEYERIKDDYPMILGKGRSGSDLIYFQLNATFLRQPKQIRVGRYITVVPDEIIGTATNHFGT